MGEALLAKYLGKTTLIAETGAGQHGVATATAAAYFGLKCEVHMGQVDILKEAPNVQRMKVLGATVVPATHGLQTLKEAVDSAFESYLKDTENSFYAIGSVVGPHPFPLMVRDFQRVLGQEAFRQWEEKFGTGARPDHVVACCGGGSNAMVNCITHNLTLSIANESSGYLFCLYRHPSGQAPRRRAIRKVFQAR